MLPPGLESRLAEIAGFLAAPAEPKLIVLLLGVGVCALVVTCVGLVLFGKH